MKKLNQREKLLLALAAVVIVVVLLMQIEPAIRQGFSGGALAVKGEQLQTAQELVHLAQIIERIDAKIRDNAGLQGRIISNSLFEEVSNKVKLEELNRARRGLDLADLHPALEEKADTLLAYKKQHGEFESLDTLKEIRGSIFEGNQPQAVIARRIDDLAKKAQLRPKQLNIKPMSGKKSEKIPIQAKKNLVLYLYMSELEGELKQLQAQQKAIEEAERKQAEAEAEAMDAMFEAWWDDDESDAKEVKKGTEAETDEQLVKGKLKSALREESNAQSDLPEHSPEATADAGQTTPPDVLTKPTQSDRQFTPLPEVIPLPVRIQILQFIQANLKLQIVGAAEFKRGFIANGIAVVDNKTQAGFLGFGGEKQAAQVRFKPDSVLLSKFEELINRYEAEYEEEILEGETEELLDYNQQLSALSTYTAQTQEHIEKLEEWFTKVPSMYQPELYTVEMNFEGELERIVRFIQSIEASSKWLFVRGLRIAITTDKKKKNMLIADLSMVAKVL